MATSSTLHHHAVPFMEYSYSIPAANSQQCELPAAVSGRLAPATGARQLSKLRLQPRAPLRACAPAIINASAAAAATAEGQAAEGRTAGGLRVGIVGFGNFGQFIAEGLRRQGHAVLAASRSDYSGYCRRHGVEFFTSVEDLCAEQPDVVLICSSILSAEGVVRSIPTHKLRPDTIFADVLSVKQFPRNLFLEVLPPEFGILCTHPMFGPESGKHGWTALPFVYDKVRIAENSAQAEKCAQFLGIFQGEGCRMVEMTCEEHDRHAAGSQFITHTIGRILSNLNLESTPINTKGYETLLQLKENTVSDSFDLYYGLFMYNVNATDQIENLDRAFETVKKKLFGRLHDILRRQIVERVPMHGTAPAPAPAASSAAFFLRPSGDQMKGLSSSFAVPLKPTAADKDQEAVSGPVQMYRSRSEG